MRRNIKSHDLHLTDSVKVDEQKIKLRISDQIGRLVAYVRFKKKLSGLTKRPARDTLSFEKSDKGVVTKTHRVDEQREDGTWETVHNEKHEV